jgi:hypothetical protein
VLGPGVHKKRDRSPPVDLSLHAKVAVASAWITTRLLAGWLPASRRCSK